jgi:hypothetical protein
MTLFRRTGSPLRPSSEPTSEDLRHSYAVRLCTRVVGTLGLAIMLIAATSESGPVGASILREGQKANASITIRVKLDRTRVVVGTPIKGTAVLTNESSKAILVQQCATDGWLAVGLANKKIGFSPAWALVRCAPSVVLKPGPNRFPLKVVTTYESCLQPGGQSTIFIPKCLSSDSSSILPPLPPGRYSTKVVTMGLPSNTAVSHSDTVRLLASTH